MRWRSWASPSIDDRGAPIASRLVEQRRAARDPGVDPRVNLLKSRVNVCRGGEPLPDSPLQRHRSFRIRAIFRLKRLPPVSIPNVSPGSTVKGPCGATSVTFLIGVHAPFDFCRKSAQEMPDACAAEGCADAVCAAPGSVDRTRACRENSVSDFHCDRSHGFSREGPSPERPPLDRVLVLGSRRVRRRSDTCGRREFRIRHDSAATRAS